MRVNKNTCPLNRPCLPTLFFSEIGTFLHIAEDAREKDRSKGRTGEVWCEVRNDSSIKNAYRHATIAQPLHTDGSYIPSYSSSIMACVSSAAVGGEPILSHTISLKTVESEIANSITQIQDQNKEVEIINGPWRNKN